MELTRQNIQTFRNEFAQAVKQMEEKYGLKIDLQNISYCPKEFYDCKIRVSKQGVDLKAVEWNRYASCYDLKKEWLGKTFNYKGSEYKIVGLNTKKRKYPVVIEDTFTGETSLFTVEGIQKLCS